MDQGANLFQLIVPNKATFSQFNRICQRLYELISSKTTQANALRMELFSVESSVSEFKEWGTKEILHGLAHLIEEKFITQAFYFYFPENKPSIYTCFLTVPSTGNSANIQNIFMAMINRSVSNISEYLDSNKSFKSREFMNELKKNFETPEAPEAINYPNSIFSLELFVRNSNAILPIAKDLILRTLEIVEQILIEKKMILPVIPEFNIAGTNSLKRFELANQFLRDTVSFRVQGKLRSDLNDFFDKEILNKENPDKVLLIKMQQERATKIHQALSQNGRYYPGYLAVKTIMALSGQIMASEIERQNVEINNELMEIKNKLQSETNLWNELILFYNERERNVRHLQLWQKLKDDSSIAFTTWYLPGEEYYVVSLNDSHILKKIIVNMEAYPPTAVWKILALRKLIDLNESMSEIFKDKKYVLIYESLLRKAYVKYFLWYDYVLFPFSFGRNIIFQKVKKKINSMQVSLKHNYNVSKNKENENKKIESQKEVEKLKNKLLKNNILDYLEKQYFFQEEVVTGKNIAEYLNIESDQAKNFLDKNGFKIIPYKKSDFDDSIVFFPTDQNLNEKSNQVRNVLIEKLKNNKILNIGSAAEDGVRQFLLHYLTKDH